MLCMVCCDGLARWLPLPVSLPLCFLGLLFGAPLLWPFVVVVGVVFVWFLFGRVFLVFVCLVVVWWAVLAASLLR